MVRDLVALGCEVIAVDPHGNARARALELGARIAVENIEDVAYADVQGAIVASPTRTHAALAEAALGWGVPVFVEKPLTDNPVSARHLVEIGGDRLFTMHKWCYHPGIRLLKQLVRDGRIGTVHGVTSERTGEANPSDTDALWLLGPHEITIGAHILGAFPNRIDAVADVSEGCLWMVGATSRTSDGHWHRWTISTRPGPPQRRVVVHGSSGIATLNGAYAEFVELSRELGPMSARRELLPIERELPLISELRAFCSHLVGGSPPPTTGADGAAVVECIVAIRNSAALSKDSILHCGSSEDSYTLP